MTAKKLTANRGFMEKILSVTLNQRRDERLKVNFDFGTKKPKQTLETRNTTFTELTRAKSYKFFA
jgi:hypothetical protein